MSLSNSDYTYFSLLEAGPEVFKSEVDRFVKEFDKGSSSQTSLNPKRARYDQDESGYGGSQASQPLERMNHPMTISGVILDVILENFLCHTFFQITLNSRLNFIVGRNGSGKSAVLTGIIVALGGSANVTGRGSSLKDFVKYNCQSARVTVTVSNCGSLNFHKKQYGNKIIVIRTIDNQGRSKIELKAEQGKTVSTKMQDLRAMCLKLGIQVDNPISVLDQNTAKTFLLQNKPADLFQLFMKATDLETLRVLHDSIDKYFRLTVNELKRKTKELENSNADLVEATRKYEILKTFEKDKIQEDLLKLELLRAQARDCFMSLDSAQKELDKLGNEKLQLKQFLLQSSKAELLEQLEITTEELKKVANQHEEVDNNFRTMNIKYKDNLREQKSCGVEMKQVDVKANHNKRMIEEFKGEITSLEKKLQPNLVENKKRLDEEMSCLEQTVKQCQHNQSESKAKLLNLQESLNKFSDTLTEVRAQEKKLQKTIVEKEEALKVLQEDKSSYARFGQNMTKLKHLIDENARNFRRKPIGPLGSFVQVRDPKWVLAIECAIKGRINNFLVDNQDDERLLRKLMQKSYGQIQPGVVRCRFLQPIDTRNSESRTSTYPNILDTIEVTDQVVRNALIELFNVECTLLIPSDDECYYLLKDARTVPRNCKKAYTLEGVSYFPDPEYRTYAAPQKEARILEVSQQTLIEGLSLNLSKLKDQLEDAKQKFSSVSFEVQNTRKHMREVESAEKKNIETLIEAKNNLEKLEDSRTSDTLSISTLKEDLAERERMQVEYSALHEKYAERLETLQSEKRELKKKGEEMKEKLNMLEKEKEPLILNQAKLKDELERLESSQTNYKNRINQILSQEEQHVSTMKEFEIKYNEKNKDVEKFESHLRSENVNLQEIPTERNVRTIDSELKTVMKRRTSVEKSFGKNMADVEKEYHEIFAVHQQVQKKIKTLEKNSMYLKEALDQRLKLYLMQRKYTGCIVSHQFTRVLLQRNCIGNIKVNFEDKLLKINVGPVDKGDKTGLGTSSLSGGERSYATMAFVIALWIVTELPFYYLDEFDVFMDLLNRQTVLALLLKFARLKRGFQFGFLTPLDTTAITESEDLSIWKLDDPRDV